MLMRIVVISAFIFLLPSLAVAHNEGYSVSSVCWEISNSHVEASTCINAMYKKYEKNLLDISNESLEKAAEFDKEYTPLTDNKVGLKEKQLLSNQSFSEYLETECDRIRQTYLSGNGAGDAYLTCKINLISERVKRLKM